MSSLFISPARSRQVIAAIVAFALVSVFVIRTSDAAFTADTTNPDNLFRTAFIDLQTEETTPLFGEGDDASLFPAVDLIPGEAIEGCIDVVYTGPADIGLENVNFDVAIGPSGDPDGLAEHLTVAVDLLSGACADTATTATPVTSNDLAALGAGEPVGTGWSPTGNETRGFDFTVTVSDAENAVDMEETVTDVDLTWSVSTTSS